MALEMIISLWIWKSRVNEFADGLDMGMRQKAVKHNAYSRLLKQLFK